MLTVVFPQNRVFCLARTLLFAPVDAAMPTGGEFGIGANKDSRVTSKRSGPTLSEYQSLLCHQIPNEVTYMNTSV